MNHFNVTVRTTGIPTYYTDAVSQSAAEAGERAADRFADVPCGITVSPGRPS